MVSLYRQFRPTICAVAARNPPLRCLCLHPGMASFSTASQRFEAKARASSSDSNLSPNLGGSVLLYKPMNVDPATVVLPALDIHVNKAVSALRAGKVIALPTDTLYGLACDACSSAAIQRIYEIKGRSVNSPLAVCVADVADIKGYGTTSDLPEGLLKELLPGPVTVILQRGNDSLLDKSLNPGLQSIGVRIPDSDFIRMVARTFGGALALTSANYSGQPSTIEVLEFEQLWPYCAYVFDAGNLVGGRAGSTIVELSRLGRFKIMREGSALNEARSTLTKFGLVEET